MVCLVYPPRAWHSVLIFAVQILNQQSFKSSLDLSPHPHNHHPPHQVRTPMKQPDSSRIGTTGYPGGVTKRRSNTTSRAIPTKAWELGGGRLAWTETSQPHGSGHQFSTLDTALKAKTSQQMTFNPSLDTFKSSSRLPNLDHGLALDSATTTLFTPVRDLVCLTRIPSCLAVINEVPVTFDDSTVSSLDYHRTPIWFLDSRLLTVASTMASQSPLSCRWRAICLRSGNWRCNLFGRDSTSGKPLRNGRTWGSNWHNEARS